ncbi:MAG: sugar phosphate isomerase/epimerase [Phycisphaeraceae bacterium]|nr:sugar phosphate isomerase/epimerase [Phycisphaeraceae bacterium]
MDRQLAFSTLSFPDRPLDRIIPAAPEMGYSGIELRTMAFGDPSAARAAASNWACEPADVDPHELAVRCTDARAIPLCLSTSISLHPADPFASSQAFSKLEYAMDLASRLGCRAVRAFVLQIDPGDNETKLVQRVARGMVRLLDRAVDQNLEIWLENAGGLSRARPWWHLANLIDHPLLGLIWNPLASLRAGESHAVSLPLLISALRMVRVADAVPPDLDEPAIPGQGGAEVHGLIKKLCGMGYQGWYAIEWNRYRYPHLTDAESVLTAASGWMGQQLEEIAESKTNPAAWGKKKLAALKAAAKADG